MRLDGALTILGCPTQRERLQQALQHAGETLELDLSAIDAMDSAGVQLLLALRKSVAARGGQLRLQALSPVVAEVFSTYGLGELANAPTPEA